MRIFGIRFFLVLHIHAYNPIVSCMYRVINTYISGEILNKWKLNFLVHLWHISHIYPTSSDSNTIHSVQFLVIIIIIIAVLPTCDHCYFSRLIFRKQPTTIIEIPIHSMVTQLTPLHCIRQENTISKKL